MGIRVVAVVIVAVVAAGVIATVTLDSQAASSSRISSATPTDDFEREPPSGGLGRVPGGPRWRVVRGEWAISLGRARTLQPTPLLAPALVTVNRSDPDGVVAVTLAQVAEGSGLVFRYQDPANFWAV